MYCIEFCVQYAYTYDNAYYICIEIVIDVYHLFILAKTESNSTHTHTHDTRVSRPLAPTIYIDLCTPYVPVGIQVNILLDVCCKLWLFQQDTLPFSAPQRYATQVVCLLAFQRFLEVGQVYLIQTRGDSMELCINVGLSVVKMLSQNCYIYIVICMSCILYTYYMFERLFVAFVFILRRGCVEAKELCCLLICWGSWKSQAIKPLSILVRHQTQQPKSGHWLHRQSLGWAMWLNFHETWHVISSPVLTVKIVNSYGIALLFRWGCWFFGVHQWNLKVGTGEGKSMIVAVASSELFERPLKRVASTFMTLILWW